MKPIKDYEDYQITEDGRIGSNKSNKGLSQSLSSGYYQIQLWKDGRYKHFLVHRLVAEAFIPNPDNLPYVNHKDEDKTNNSVDNLEWCTAAYNNSYGSRVHLRCKSVEQLDDKGNVIRIGDSITNAANELNICRRSISKVLKGTIKTAGGYKGKYYEQYNI